MTLDVRRLYQHRLHVMSGLGSERREDLERALHLGAMAAVFADDRILIKSALEHLKAGAVESVDNLRSCSIFQQTPSRDS